MRQKVHNSWTLDLAGEKSLREETEDGFVVFRVGEGESVLKIFTVVYLMNDPLIEHARSQEGGANSFAEREVNRAEKSPAEILRTHVAETGWPLESEYPFAGNKRLAGYSSVRTGTSSELVFHALVASPREILAISSDCDRRSLSQLLQIWNSALN